jgi:hypothetical protein
MNSNVNLYVSAKKGDRQLERFFKTLSHLPKMLIFDDLTLSRIQQLELPFWRCIVGILAAKYIVAYPNIDVSDDENLCISIDKIVDHKTISEDFSKLYSAYVSGTV